MEKEIGIIALLGLIGYFFYPVLKKLFSSLFSSTKKNSKDKQHSTAFSYFQDSFNFLIKSKTLLLFLVVFLTVSFLYKLPEFLLSTKNGLSFFEVFSLNISPFKSLTSLKMSRWYYIPSGLVNELVMEKFWFFVNQFDGENGVVALITLGFSIALISFLESLTFLWLKDYVLKNTFRPARLVQRTLVIFPQFISFRLLVYLLQFFLYVINWREKDLLIESLLTTSKNINVLIGNIAITLFIYFLSGIFLIVPVVLVILEEKKVLIAFASVKKFFFNNYVKYVQILLLFLILTLVYLALSSLLSQLSYLMTSVYIRLTLEYLKGVLVILMLGWLTVILIRFVDQELAN